MKLFTKLSASIFFLLLFFKVNAATITAGATGSWTSTSTWTGGVVPATGDVVVIPSGKTVTYTPSGTTNSSYYSFSSQPSDIQVTGTLIFSSTTSYGLQFPNAITIEVFSGGTLTDNLKIGAYSFNLQTSSITVYSGGIFSLGSNNTYGNTGFEKGTGGSGQILVNPGSGPFTITANSSAVTYSATAVATSTTWSGSSWNAGTPTSTVDAIIASNTTPGSFTCKALTINSGVALTIGSGVTATVNGNITNSGNGISGVGNLTIAASSALSGTAFSFNGVLTVNSGAILTTNSLLTLSSNSTATASLAAVAGSISGNVTVERYIPAHTTKSYTLVSSPVSSPTIYTAWQEGGASTSGYGTKITGASTGNGFDAASAAGIASMYSYNDANSGTAKWVGLTNTNVNTLTAGTGYLLFVRGDRTIGTGVSSSSATTLRATGTLTTGTVTFATSGGTTGTPHLLATSGTYNLIANPYPCAIDWTNAGVTKTNVSSTFTVYDPNLGSFVTSDGTTVSPNTGRQQAKYIQSGQAFFILSTSAAPQLTIAESAKTTSTTTGSSTTVFGNETPDAQLNFNVYKTSTGKSDVFADGAVAVFNNSYTRGLDQKDAHKFSNFYENVSFVCNNTNLSIEGRPFPAGADTLFVNMQQIGTGMDYKIVIDATGFNNNNITSATLIDQLTGNTKLLDLGTKNEYVFTNDTTSNKRFMIVFSNAGKLTAIDNSIANNAIATYPNPIVNELRISSKTVMNTVRVIDARGEPSVIQTNINSLQTKLNVSNLTSGMYMVEVTDVNGNRAVKKVIK